MIKLFFVLIISSFNLSDACDCAPPNRKEAYCKSNFVGTIRILKQARACGERDICYYIIVTDQLRGTPITPTTLRTSSDSAACGVTLTQGNTYFVITNPIDLKTIRLNSCQISENWTGLTRSEVKNKKQEYQKFRCIQ